MPQGEIGWRSLYFVLSLYIYLFLICLFIACLCICFLITLREQLCGLAPWGAISVFWPNLFSCGFDAGCDEKLAFFFNLLLLLFILLLSIVSMDKPVY